VDEVTRAPRPTGPNEEIVELLRDVNRELREQIVRRGEAEGFARFSRRLPIAREVLHEPGITVNELARRTRIPKSQVSIIVGLLADDGLVRREGDVKDQRLVRIFPTEEGSARFERWRASYRTMLKSMVRALSEEEADHLLEGLRALHRVLASDRAQRLASGDAR
jgi:DNA-binding MarR family transcriptional regulator